MSAFFLFHNRKVRDSAGLERYKEAVAPLVAAFGGRYRVLGGDPVAVEGDWHPGILVLIEFPILERATAWYESEEYRPLKAMRLATVDGEGLVLSGLQAAT